MNSLTIRQTMDLVRDRCPISDDYYGRICDAILPEVEKDVKETADKDNWNEDDVRLAIGRVLCDRLGIEH